MIEKDRPPGRQTDPTPRSGTNPAGKTPRESAGPRPRSSGSEGSSPLAGLLRLAGPLVVSFSLRSAFAWVDTIYAAQLEGVVDASIAAIGLTLPFEFLMIACWVGTSNGLTARLAAAMGAHEGAKVEQLERATRRIIYVLNGLFLVLAASIWLTAERVGLEAVTAHQFRVYATVLLAGSAFTSFWSILPDSLIKAHHDTRSTMWAGLLSGTLNILLNTLFVFVFHWGLFGIALSTVVGRIGGLVYALIRAAHHEQHRRVTGRDTAPGLFAAPVRAILSLSLPAAFAFALMSFESLAVNALLARGPDPTPTLAAWSIFDRATRFLAMPVIAVSAAMLPYAARLWGQQRSGDILRSLRGALVIGGLYVSLVVTPAVLLAGPWVAGALADSEATRRYAETGLWFVPLAVASLAPLFLIRSTFEGMQRARPGLVIALVRSLMLVLPMTWLGLKLAPALAVPPITGALLGYGAALAIASALMALWIWRAPTVATAVS